MLRLLRLIVSKKNFTSVLSLYALWKTLQWAYFSEVLGLVSHWTTGAIVVRCPSWHHQYPDEFEPTHNPFAMSRERYLDQVRSVLPALELLPLHCSRSSQDRATPMQAKWIKLEAIHWDTAGPCEAHRCRPNSNFYYNYNQLIYTCRPMLVWYHNTKYMYAVLLRAIYLALLSL